MSTALDRLKQYAEPTQDEFTVDEQLKSADADDNNEDDVFMKNMQNLANQHFEEVKLEEPESEQEQNEYEEEYEEETQEEEYSEEVEEDIEEEPEEETYIEREEKPVEQPKRKAGRPKKSETINKTSNSANMGNNPVYNKLAKDLINALRNDNYTIDNFDKQSMEMILEYMETKF